MGDLKLAFFLAFKSIIRGNRWALVLIMLVMSLSFANLILTPSILSGVTKAMDSQQVDTVFGNIVIDPAQNKYYLEQTSAIEKQVAKVPGVAAVSSHLNGGALFEYGWQDKLSPQDRGDSGTWQVIGIDPQHEAGITTIYKHIIEGSYLGPDDRDQIVLGVEIAGGPLAQAPSFQTLGVHVGDSVRLTYSNGLQREYKVKGIFQVYEMQADREAFVTRKEMASVLGRNVFDDRASQVLVKIGPGADQSSVLGNIKMLGIDGVVRSWKEYGSMGGIVSSFGMITSLIGGIGLVVAAIVMFIVIYINVLNKRRQIGILRAIGIKEGVIVTSYVLQALFYAIFGVVFGGLIFGYAIKPYFDIFPISLPIGQVSLAISPVTIQNAVLGLILAAVFAGFIPVLSITRQTIIKAIWGG